MTAFNKINLQFDGMYLTYNGSRFVARFKRCSDASSFIACLIKNFTVEEYFAHMDAGIAPLTIAESKGYLLPHIKKWLKEGGYTIDRAGVDALIADQIASRNN